MLYIIHNSLSWWYSNMIIGSSGNLPTFTNSSAFQLCSQFGGDLSAVQRQSPRTGKLGREHMGEEDPIHLS